jgi:hypothetical protein
MNTIKTDDQIFKALNLLTIDRVICYTDKGLLTLKIRKGDNKYHLCLDSVPLDPILNKELMELLFPIKNEIPQVDKGLALESLSNVEFIKTKNKGGRPKKK